ncbi:DUF7471 family protein [Halomarina oriensis]|uniref:Uncharacterized protein n=1 Tax=Halomarina oriensis TaxID=671145 RepID=A0A6B0GMI2_9EURY|nr:hypothetical protein [Halomarina oriensis]MWG35860.1 hypothetical protein [Halomarina oriensis]
MGGVHDSGLALSLILAGGGSLLLVGLAAAAFVQRRSRSYLLVTLALATLLLRTLAGTLTMNGVLDATLHHTAEHALDVALVGFLLVAVYTARSDRARATGAGERR